ncbi:MAG: CPBP family intramembrane metalloprotease [Chlamydiae bacterium]|nr:CPBP family intramembrane metalloprotease [Chlamydiota bacterium]
MINPSEEIINALSLGAVSFLTIWIAWRKNFFRWRELDLSEAPVSLWHVIAVFGIYFFVTIFCSSIIIKLLRILLPFLGMSTDSMHLLVWIHLLVSSLILFLLLLFGNGFNPRTMKAVWHRGEKDHHHGKDVAIGALAWILSFPLVLFASQILDLFVYLAFHIEKLPDQSAVEFLKMTMDYPFYFFLNLLSIVVFAPLIEELLFRGFLQTYARKFFGPLGAISISSICFSLFHFTLAQGLGNIPIIGSLLVLSFFLGFIYERQNSLWASISLHAIFNALSVLNLYFVGRTPGAL